jgi:hypothetical protein
MDYFKQLKDGVIDAGNTAANTVSSTYKKATGSTSSQDITTTPGTSNVLGATPEKPGTTITGGRRHRKRRNTKRHVGGRKTRRRAGERPTGPNPGTSTSSRPSTLNPGTYIPRGRPSGPNPGTSTSSRPVGGSTACAKY